MFYRMTRLHWVQERTDEFIRRAESLFERLEQIDGLEFAELAQTGDGEGMILAAYRDDADYSAASEVEAFSEATGDLLTSTPHGHEGTAIASYGKAPSAG